MMRVIPASSAKSAGGLITRPTLVWDISAKKSANSSRGSPSDFGHNLVGGLQPDLC